MTGYDAYECPCNGTGQSTDPTLTDNAVAGPVHRVCTYCAGFKAIYVLEGYEPPRYAGARVKEGQRDAIR